jgi:hypothetical protein
VPLARVFSQMTSPDVAHFRVLAAAAAPVGAAAEAVAEGAATGASAAAQAIAAAPISRL